LDDFSRVSGKVPIYVGEHSDAQGLSTNILAWGISFAIGLEACVWIKMEDRVATFYYKKYYEKVFANTPTNN
jgi:hypothetical protein